MKNYLIITIALMLILFTSCKGGQLFMEVRSTYNLPVNDRGQVTLSDIENDISKVKGMGDAPLPVYPHYGLKGWGVLQPQFNVTYRQYIFDNKKYGIKEQQKKK
tara:strand:- start:408 stop:719 length:312 start_codon:yes stop_codon:yes gene_type:complete